MILPRFSLITGIDCCGKGTIFNELVNILESKEIRYLDLRQKELENRKLSDYDVILTCEPTFNSRLRRVMFDESEKYSTLEFAEEFASDRQKQYNEIILPAHDLGKIVIQDRGFTDSLVYQSIQAKVREENLTLADIAKLKGNQVALGNLPGAIFITHISAKTADERREKRTGKIDQVEFESGDYPAMLSRGYRDKNISGIGRLNWRAPIEAQIVDIECEQVKKDVHATKELVISQIKSHYSKIGVDLFI